jgi:hypothetical protein
MKGEDRLFAYVNAPAMTMATSAAARHEPRRGRSG